MSTPDVIYPEEDVRLVRTWYDGPFPRAEQPYFSRAAVERAVREGIRLSVLGAIEKIREDRDRSVGWIDPSWIRYFQDKHIEEAMRALEGKS